jgi:O-antigen ligase
VLYALYYSKSLRLKVLLATISIFGFYALLLVNSRTILLAFIICTIIFFILSVFSKKFSLLKWLIIPFTTILVFISNPFNEFSSFSLNQDRITLSDANTTARLDYYKLAWDYFIDHPIIGVGLGNWKIESLAFQNKLMKDYTVSYHVHNDFLELAVELGLFGVLAYLLLFAFGFRTVYLLRKNIFFLFLGASLLIYFVDSMLNFPMSRVSDQIMFVLLMAFFVSPNSSINENS